MLTFLCCNIVCVLCKLCLACVYVLVWAALFVLHVCVYVCVWAALFGSVCESLLGLYVYVSGFVWLVCVYEKLSLFCVWVSVCECVMYCMLAALRASVFSQSQITSSNLMMAPKSLLAKTFLWTTAVYRPAKQRDHTLQVLPMALSSE